MPRRKCNGRTPRITRKARKRLGALKEASKNR